MTDHDQTLGEPTYKTYRVGKCRCVRCKAENAAWQRDYLDEVQR